MVTKIVSVKFLTKIKFPNKIVSFKINLYGQALLRRGELEKFSFSITTSISILTQLFSVARFFGTEGAKSAVKKR